MPERATSLRFFSTFARMYDIIPDLICVPRWVINCKTRYISDDDKEVACFNRDTHYSRLQYLEVFSCQKSPDGWYGPVVVYWHSKIAFSRLSSTFEI